MDSKQKIVDELARWEADNDVSSLPGAESDLGEPLKVLYTPAEVAENDYLEKIGFPGEYPFTRGVYLL